jgi:cytochrome c
MMLVIFACSSLPLAAVQAQGARVERGHAFAQAHCSECHAVSREGESPLQAAPPLRTLHRRYPVESLAESLAEGIATGHPAMPQFKLNVAQIGDLIAYLKSLE